MTSAAECASLLAHIIYALAHRMSMGMGIKVAVRRMTGVTIRWNTQYMTAGVTVVVGAVFQRSVGKRIGMTVGANVLVRAGITA